MKTGGEKFVGRKVQLAKLREVLTSQRSSFIVVYGRRRVGKTFLIREAAKNKFAFYFTGAHGVTKKEQLINFTYALKSYSKNEEIKNFTNWTEALHALAMYLKSLPKGKNKIIFFDELPWIDTPKSGFLGAFEYFWNTYCAFNGDMKLIICGSATSWIIKKVFHNRGGLHNRITHSFLVEPFNLCETKEYFKAYGFRYSEQQLSEIYMILGGIPYYFSYMEKGESVAKNIDSLFFSQSAKLKGEFQSLYSSLFSNSDIHERVVRELSKVRKGMTRQELLEKLKLKGNGGFSTVLKELEECGFIRRYMPFEETSKTTGKRAEKKSLYQLIDLFTLFYLHFAGLKKAGDENFWTSNYKDPKITIWRGFAFEKLCLWHINQIKEALGISGMSVRICSWFGKNSEGEMAQIDLLIDRKDGVVNLCEMKYSNTKFSITKSYAEDIERKIDVFLEATKTKKIPVVTFITTEGVKEGYYRELAQREIILKQLFAY